MQALMFPLTIEELKAKGKEMAALELKFEEIAAEKDTKSREYNDELKKIRGQILRLSKEIDEERVMRDASDEEAPWQGLMEQASDKASGRRGPKRDRTGAYPDAEEEKE